MRLVFALAALGLLAAARIDLTLVEDGTTGLVSNGATDGGQLLVSGYPTGELVLLRAATCTSGSCTRDPPDSGAEGIEMGDIQAVRLMVCAPGDQTLTGSGTLEAWAWDPTINRAGAIPAKTVFITRTDSCQAAAVEVNDMAGARVRLTYRAVGVGVSGTDGGSLIVSVGACKMGRKAGCAP